MLSGVGPAATLSNLSIPVIADIPAVGQNMHDTTNIGGPSGQISTPSFTALQNDPAVMDTAVEQLRANGSRPLSNPTGDFVGWEKLPQQYRTNFTNATSAAFAHWPADWPELEIVLADEKESFVEAPALGTSMGSLGVLVVAAITRGNVTISSNSIDDPQIINTNWLLVEADQQMAVAAYHRAREIWSHLGAAVGPELTPETNVTSDADLLEYIQESGVSPIDHGSLTCRMGALNDTTAVVDTKARVKGVNGLRVIDVSRLRFTPPGHTQGTTCGFIVFFVVVLYSENHY